MPRPRRSLLELDMIWRMIYFKKQRLLCFLLAGLFALSASLIWAADTSDHDLVIYGDLSRFCGAQRLFPDIEPQTTFAALLVRSVVSEAFVGQQRTDFAIELHS